MKINSVESISKAVKGRRKQLGLTQAETAAMCNVGARFFSGLLPEEDFSLLAENLDIKESVFSKIFNDYKIKSSKAFESLKTDEKPSRDILDLIAESMEARF